MGKITNYFITGKNVGLYEKQKTIAFIVIAFIGFSLTFLNVIYNIVLPNKNGNITIITSIITNIFVIVSFILLKKYNLKVAGNIFSAGLVIIVSISLNVLNADVSVDYKFHQGFYTIFGLLVFSVLIASRKVLIINTFIILISTTKIYLFAIEQEPMQKELYSSGYFSHTITLIGISSILYFAIKFAEKAIKDAKEDARIKAVQNQELIASEEEIRASLEELKTTTDALSETNDELYVAKKKAEESDNLKSIFLTNMSHEIRTPLNGIIGFSNLLNSEENNNNKSKYYTEIISKSGEQLLKIIDDIIEISQLETNQIKLYSNKINLTYILLNLIEMYKYDTDKKGIELGLENSLNDNINIYTDESKLIKILQNLIENAIKFTKKGFVKVSCSRKNDIIEFIVQDTGIGFKQGEHFDIFDRFVQADKDISIEFGGLGLGLSIAKLNTELLGGKIKATSEIHKGSKFYFTIPYNPVKVEEQ